MLNWMGYMRGHSGDFDEWEKMGNPGWGYKDVLPYFKKSQNYADGDSKYHGKEGPMGVESARFVHPMFDVVSDAAKELGYAVGDVNGEFQTEGFFGPHQTSTKGGWRMGTFRSFVEPLLATKNIDVLTYAFASKVLIKNGNEAHGVRVERFGKEFDFHATREVVLSAGAIASPQIMMLSGLGAKSDLSKHGIEIVKDMPGVGQNLQDHIVGSQILYADGPQPMTANFFDLANPFNFARFFNSGDGPMSATGIETSAFLRTPAQDKVGEYITLLCTLAK